MLYNKNNKITGGQYGYFSYFKEKFAQEPHDLP